MTGIAEAVCVGKPFRLPKGLDVQFGLPDILKNSLKHFLVARPAADMQRCVLCGACRDACPPNVITIKNSALSIDTKRCIRCWCCRELCPHDAMEVRRSLVMKLFTALREAGA